MSKTKVEVVGHSLSPQGDELLSVLVTYPRIIHSEVMTHRMLSKNSASSRAIPFKRMVKMVMSNPFVPYAFQKDHTGMQGTEYLDSNKKYFYEEISDFIESFLKKAFQNEDGTWDKDYHELGITLNNILYSFFGDGFSYTLSEWWLKVRDMVVASAIILHAMGTTKQLCNRLLEPFMWMTVLITGSKEGWDNFFDLRCPVYDKGYLGIYKSWKDLCDAERQSYNGASTFLYEYDDDILTKLQSNSGKAEIHLMDLAEKIWDAKNESTPNQLQAGEWHVPFSKNIDLIDLALNYPDWQDFEKVSIKIATAMAARTSYTTVGEEKEMSYEDLIRIFDTRLLPQPDEPFHASPHEHCARATSDEEYYGSLKGTGFRNQDDDVNNYQLMKDRYGEDHYTRMPLPDELVNGRLIHEHFLPHKDPRFGWLRNFKGFIQLRHLIETNQF